MRRQSLVHKVHHAGNASWTRTELRQAAEIHTPADGTAAARSEPFATLGHAELLQTRRDLAMLRCQSNTALAEKTAENCL